MTALVELVNYNEYMEYNSQIGQDQLIDFILNKKENGFFLDIGAKNAISVNNTNFFEKYRNWSGIAFEINPEWNNEWINRKKTLHICADARNIRYSELLKERDIQVVDYISLDLDPPGVTLEVLSSLLSSNIEFKTMTFEVDAYLQQSTKNISRTLLSSNGYELAYELNYTDDADPAFKNIHVDDVWVNKKYIKEFNFIKSVINNKLEFNLRLGKFVNINENCFKL